VTRQEAYDLVRPRFSNNNLFNHVLAVEAVMRELADHLHQDVETWGLAGLLHDLDYEETVNSPERHTLVTEEILREYDVAPEIIHAVKSHNHLAPLDSLMDKALYAADPVTGLIVASTFMHPERRLNAVSTEFVLRRFKEKGFARGANREQIRSCEGWGLSLESFVTIALAGMQKISTQLGL